MTTRKQWAVGLLSVAMCWGFGTGLAAAVPALSFDNPTVDGGSVIYGGAGGPVTATDVIFQELIGVDTPANAGTQLFCFPGPCLLSFTTGDNTGEGPPTWTFDGGGSITMTGGLNTGIGGSGMQIVPGGSVLISSGSFDGPGTRARVHTRCKLAVHWIGCGHEECGPLGILRAWERLQLCHDGALPRGGDHRPRYWSIRGDGNRCGLPEHCPTSRGTSTSHPAPARRRPHGDHGLGAQAGPHELSPPPLRSPPCQSTAPPSAGPWHFGDTALLGRPASPSPALSKGRQPESGRCPEARSLVAQPAEEHAFLVGCSNATERVPKS